MLVLSNPQLQRSFHTFWKFKTDNGNFQAKLFIMLCRSVYRSFLVLSYVLSFADVEPRVLDLQFTFSPCSSIAINTSSYPIKGPGDNSIFYKCRKQEISEECEVCSMNQRRVEGEVETEGLTSLEVVIYATLYMHGM